MDCPFLPTKLTNERRTDAEWFNKFPDELQYTDEFIHVHVIELCGGFTLSNNLAFVLGALQSTLC